MTSSSSPSETGSAYGRVGESGVNMPEESKRSDELEPFEEMCKGRSMLTAPVSGLMMSTSTVRPHVSTSGSSVIHAQSLL